MDSEFYSNNTNGVESLAPILNYDSSSCSSADIRFDNSKITWRFLEPGNPTLSFETVRGGEITENCKNELQQVILKLSTAIGTPNPSVVQIVAFWLRPFVKLVLRQCTLMAKKKGCLPPNILDIKEFMRVELLCMILGRSPSMLFNQNAAVNELLMVNANKKLSPERHKAILAMLSDSPFDRVPGQTSPVVTNLEAALSKICSIGFIHNVSIVSIDDDKIPASRTLTGEMGESN